MVKDFVKVSNEEFIKVYMASRTHRQVADRTGMSLTAVQMRARYLRKKGVTLPRPKGKGHIDVDALNGLIQSHKAGLIGMGELDTRPPDSSARVDNARAEGQ